MNLMSNAMKFTMKGYIKVILESYKEDESSEYIRVSVEDSGIGVK